MGLKTLIVGGITRSGKSEFCKRMVQYHHYSHVSIDSEIFAFKHVYPELNIRFGTLDYDVICDNLLPFLTKQLEHMSRDNGFQYVVETYHIRPSDIPRLRASMNCNAVFFGFPTISVDQKVRDIREYSANNSCWTEELSEEELYSSVQRYITKSQALRDECAAHDVRFVDTSSKFCATLDALIDKSELSALER